MIHDVATNNKTSFDPKNLLAFNTDHSPRAYVNSSIRFHHEFTYQQRLDAALKAGWNVFQFPSEMLKGGDLLSDSGTTTMTSEQVAAMWLGDEAYGSNYGYFLLLSTFEKTFGIHTDNTELYLFHQGRAAEHALFSQIGRTGRNLIIPSNGHFDTARANIESNHMTAIDCFSDNLYSDSPDHFKGNMNLDVLEKLLKTDARRIPLVFVTITNNTGGGQPVSLQNIKDVRELCNRYNKPLFLDACRFAENSYFIKMYESGQGERKIRDIVHDICSLCDGFTISLKKDGLANMGGALLIKKDSPFVRNNPDIPNALRDHQILTEGHPTYGGLSGRDSMTICEGLKTVITEQYLASRINQVQSFGSYIASKQIPVVEPFGGHAIYIDVDRFFADTSLRRKDYGGISLTALLLLKGVRLCELGAFAFGDSHPHNFVRCAIPRNKYEREDLAYVGDCIANMYEQRHRLPRAIPVYGRDLSLRHFKARFDLELSL